jgi:hypothetical protein
VRLRESTSLRRAGEIERLNSGGEACTRTARTALTGFRSILRLRPSRGIARLRPRSQSRCWKSGTSESVQRMGGKGRRRAGNQLWLAGGWQHVSSRASCLSAASKERSGLFYCAFPVRPGRKFLNEDRPARPPHNCRVYGGSCLALWQKTPSSFRRCSHETAAEHVHTRLPRGGPPAGGGTDHSTGLSFH